MYVVVVVFFSGFRFVGSVESVLGMLVPKSNSAFIWVRTRIKTRKYIGNSKLESDLAMNNDTQSILKGKLIKS